MTTDLADPTQQTDIAERIAAAVHERTGGRFRDARVIVGLGVVTIRGTAPSYYLKQLAIEAANVALRGLPFQLVLEVTVHAR